MMTEERSGLSLTQQWNQRDDRYVLGWRHGPRVVFERGKGVWLTDVEGREYLDFVSGHISLLLGHNHPELHRALVEQAGRLWHQYKYFAAAPVIEFAERLAGALPAPLGKINFASVGSEANEVALRIARGATGKFDLVAVVDGLYGGTLGVEALNSIGGRRKRGLGPMLMPSRAHAIVTPYCYRCPLNLTYPQCDIACLNESDQNIDRFTSGEVAAIITETILGAGGMIVPPPEWLPRLKALADKWGALLILDEVQVAPVKTGRTWCFEHYGTVPDILTLGKAIGGGTAIAATVTSDAIAEKAAGKAGVPWAGTFAGEPLYAAVAARQFQILIEEDYASRAARLGEHFMKGLLALKERYEVVGDVRGKGMYVGVEIVKDKAGKAPDPEAMHRIRWNAMEERLLIAGSGTVLKLFPALVITEAEIDEGVGRLEQAIRRAMAGEPRGVRDFTNTSVN
jgi:2,2-dialkylglycine decarboxylase (pyruvate)